MHSACYWYLFISVFVFLVFVWFFLIFVCFLLVCLFVCFFIPVSGQDNMQLVIGICIFLFACFLVCLLICLFVYSCFSRKMCNSSCYRIISSFDAETLLSDAYIQIQLLLEYPPKSNATFKTCKIHHVPYVTNRDHP